MGVRVVGLGLGDLLRGHALRVEHGLLTNDSLGVGATIELGAALASADRALAGVPGLSVYGPRDVPGSVAG
jgi:hypothetical protein